MKEHVAQCCNTLAAQKREMTTYMLKGTRNVISAHSFLVPLGVRALFVQETCLEAAMEKC